jgi:hypothetical protein
MENNPSYARIIIKLGNFQSTFARFQKWNGRRGSQALDE